jgi:fucose 4-O-acetylase-like acetyltransferase
MTLKTFLSRFLFISVLGVLLHFTYEWSGDNPIVALFSAVNESTWEHLKLLFFPMLLLTIIELLFTEKRQLPSNYLFARTIGILSGMAFIVIAFYTLTGVFAKLPDAVNIALYFLGVFLALCIENKINRGNSQNHSAFAAIVLLALTIAFFVFTKYPPSIGLFANPVLTGFHRSEGADCILRYALHGKALLF